MLVAVGLNLTPFRFLCETAFAAGPGASAKTCWRTTATTARFREAVPEN
jgi:hypothetical protein